MLARSFLAVAAECLFRQLVQLLEEGFGARQRGLWIFTDLGQALGQEIAGGFDQREHVAVGPLVLCPGFLDEAFQWCDYSSNGCDAGGMGAAFEGMQGPGKIIGVGNRGLVSGC